MWEYYLEAFDGQFWRRICQLPDTSLVMALRFLADTPGVEDLRVNAVWTKVGRTDETEQAGPIPL